MNSNLKVDTDESGLESPFTSQRSFLFILSSNLFFFVASVLYLYVAINNFWYEQQVKDIPLHVLEVDDDELWDEWGFEDDYIFQTKAGIWVSEYTIVYVSAAVCFVFAGIIDLIHWKSMVNVLMILAADFGAAAAVYAEINPRVSHILYMISVHLWLLEAFTVFYNRSFFGTIKLWLRLGDTCFVIGTFMDVILSWFYVSKSLYRGGLPLAHSEIAAACFWLIAATIYLVTTIIFRATRPIVTKPMITGTMSGTDEDLHHADDSSEDGVDPVITVRRDEV